MDRRRVLRGVAGLLAGVGLAGCTGSQGEVPVTAEPPPPGVGRGSSGGAGGGRGDGGDGPPGSPSTERAVTIEDFDANEADDGTLLVSITVSNDSAQRQVRLARATVSLGTAESVAERFVAVEAGGTATVRIPVDVSYQAWLDGGSYVPELVDRTPATPLPTATQTPTPTTDPADTPTSTSTSTSTSEATGSTTPSPGVPSDDSTAGNETGS